MWLDLVSSVNVSCHVFLVDLFYENIFFTIRVHLEAKKYTHMKKGSLKAKLLQQFSIFAPPRVVLVVAEQNCQKRQTFLLGCF